MALYRTISMGFWTDAKVVDDFTPEDRYFYLYLFTNPHTNLCGCYEISIRQISNEIGYSKQSVENLLERFIKVHNVIAYSQDTKEVLLLNWHKYNWIKSDKYIKALTKEIAAVKNNAFKDYLGKVLSGDNTVSIPYQYGIDTTITNTITNTIADTKYPCKEIIDYLNQKAGTRYKHTGDKTQAVIRARMNEKFTLDDFMTVIDKKVAEWSGTDMAKYLRPETLFGTKFESYLNQPTAKKKSGNKFNNFQGRDYNWSDLEAKLIQAQG